MNWNYCPACGKQETLEKPDRTVTTCRDCGYTHYNNAKAATALAIVRDDQLLIARRGREPNKGMYELAGGFVDYGESAQAGAIREAKEELGITIQEADLRLIAAYYNPYNTETFSIDLTFLITRWQGDISANDDVAGVLWKPLEFIYDPSFCQKHYAGLDERIREALSPHRS